MPNNATIAARSVHAASASPADAGQRRDEQPFGEQLPDHAAAAGAERQPHRDFTVPRKPRASITFDTLAHAVTSTSTNAAKTGDRTASICSENGFGVRLGSIHRLEPLPLVVLPPRVA